MFLHGCFPAVYMFCCVSVIKSCAVQETSHIVQAAADKCMTFVKCHFTMTKSECACTTDMLMPSCSYSNRRLANLLITNQV